MRLKIVSHPYIQLAKKTIETYIKAGKVIPLSGDLSEEFPCGELVELFNRKAGTFVTIMKDGQLRGCIGTYLPTKEDIGKEIISNAIAAATEDYRFGPIREEELPHLSYTVYILGEPELVKAIKELDPKKYGIIVKTIPIKGPTGIDVVFNGHFVAKTGLLLPDLEEVDTVEKQISIACQKGGIDPVREKILIYKFTVEKYQ